MPIAFAVKGTKPSRIYSSPPSYFPVQTVSPLKMISLPKVLLWKLPIQRPIIWMIYTNMFMNHSEIYRTAIIIYIQLCALESGCYDAAGFTLNRYLKRVQGSKHLWKTFCQRIKKRNDYLNQMWAFIEGLHLNVLLDTTCEKLNACNYDV